MSILDQIKPTKKHRIYDLVRDAGFDVSDWEASKGDARSTASNPKYCYNWSFIQPDEFVVLNLWHSDMIEKDGIITDEWNAREIAGNSKGITNRRATDMDNAIQLAFLKKLPVRVVLCVGRQRNRKDPDSVPSKVNFRKLDPEPWHVAKYNNVTGQATLRRGLGSQADKYTDQFDSPVSAGGPTGKVSTNLDTFIRRPEVRRNALMRSGGKCEYCGEKGFAKEDGKIYLETHHVVSLSENGSDTMDNVVALCPNHHREAHYGKNRTMIRNKLERILNR